MKSEDLQSENYQFKPILFKNLIYSENGQQFREYEIKILDFDLLHWFLRKILALTFVFILVFSLRVNKFSLFNKFSNFIKNFSIKKLHFFKNFNSAVVIVILLAAFFVICLNSTVFKGLF